MAGFTKLLVANRGEIAVRVIRSAQALGYPCVAVYSEADTDAPHVELADEAVCIGPAPARESYLDGQRILDAARVTGADAIHPGYGFLAENAEFAVACAWAGALFVGPPPEAISIMGDKAQARKRMLEAKVPCVPGWEGDDQDDASLTAAAESVGYPLLVKAAAGGGGRGMRRVDTPDQLAEALASARAEAKSAFGNDRLLLERLVEGARHVEVQVLADSHGHVIHLGERDCSTQRRYQKVIEECPSPAVDADLRRRMGEAAVAAAEAVGYQGAGTVELLLGADGEFYFLEMNTRLQVEHPVTELVTGVDLVEQQLRVAAGEVLSIQQDAVTLTGHAIEVRLYAEDPAAGHLPQTGRVLTWRPASGPGLRCDHGLRSGQEITPHYDSMVAKLIAYGDDREEARRRLLRGLEQTVLLGVRHNGGFLGTLLRHPRFVAGEVTTGFVESELEAEAFAAPELSPDLIALAAALWCRGSKPAGDGWRNSGVKEFGIPLLLDGECHELRVESRGLETWRVTVADEPQDVVVAVSLDGHVRYQVGTVRRSAACAWEAGRLHLSSGGRGLVVEEKLPQGTMAEETSDGTLRSPASGVVTSLSVAPGDQVEAGQRVLTLESMKIESPLICSAPGKVSEVRVAVGDQVSQRQVLVVIEIDDAAT